MNIENIALVRATNIIPFDGIVHPLSEVSYLKKENGTEFSKKMSNLLERKGKFKQLDFSNFDKIIEIGKENNRILAEYMPYSSDYNSMVLWSLNGLVPDDINNTFSNKTVAIIEALSEQIEQSEIISLMPTDTSIKGNVNLSKQASILVNKERYESLSQEEKDKLAKLNLDITIFEGDLKEAIDQKLQEKGKYTAETLSLTREKDGYVKSDTSDEVRQTIKRIADEKKIAQVLHLDVITGKNDELDKLNNVKDEFDNYNIVRDFYKKKFFEYLFSKMDIDNEVKKDALNWSESSKYMENLCNEIDRIGIDKYKEIVDEYNKSLEQLRENGKLPTPQQIVDSSKEKNMLSSAIEATKESTEINSISEQAINIKENYKSKDEVTQEIDRSE